MLLAGASSRRGLLNLAASDWLSVALFWAISCGLLWGAFYTVRRIGRGFREPRRTK
jgi:hypothetical protein